MVVHNTGVNSGKYNIEKQINNNQLSNHNENIGNHNENMKTIITVMTINSKKNVIY